VIHRIKRNDTVQVLSGKDKGKKGLVLEVSVSSGKVLVQGVQIVTRHLKARKQGKASEIKKSESFILLSKVMLVCSACHIPSRVNSKIVEDGKRVRVCNRCEQIT
jgi:large subunit ribosomal protein L24